MARKIAFLFVPHNHPFYFWERLCSPRWGMVAVRVDDIVYFLDHTEGPRPTTIAAFRKRWPQHEEIAYVVSQATLDYYFDELLRTKDQDRSSLWATRMVYLGFLDGHNCVSLASLLTPEKHLNADSFYDYLKENTNVGQ
jgi:hypothetical protein